MSEDRKRILFLCAQRSLRSLMAASLLVAQEGPWDVWSTPASFHPHEGDLAGQVLDELRIPLLTSPQTTEPSTGLFWDEGVILCSGQADF